MPIKLDEIVLSKIKVRVKKLGMICHYQKQVYLTKDGDKSRKELVIENLPIMPIIIKSFLENDYLCVFVCLSDFNDGQHEIRSGPICNPECDIQKVINEVMKVIKIINDLRKIVQWGHRNEKL